jgi:hypothetical protein
MDALDEFFRVWSEPEAWCQRCGECPAMHIAVQDQTEPEGILITCVRVWDPHSQQHIALCRRCSQHHVDNLGRPFQQSSPSSYYAPPLYRPQRRLLPAKPQWWHRGLAWSKRVLFWLVYLWAGPRRAHTQTVAKRYPGMPSKH